MLVALGRHLLGVGQHGLGVAEVQHGQAALVDLQRAGDEVAFLAGVLAVGQLALGLAQALHQHLLRGLRDDAAEVVRVVDPLGDDVAVVVELLREHGDLAASSRSMTTRASSAYGLARL